MKILRHLVGRAGILFAAGCASQPRIATDYVAGTDFSRYRTFSLIKRLERPPGGPTALASIRQSVEETLRAKGYVPAPPAEADLLVMIHGRLNPRVTVHEYGYDMPRHPWRAGDFSIGEERVIGAETTVTKVGRLTVDVIDRRTDELIWRSVSQKDGVPDTPDAQRIGAAIGRILQQFPVLPGPP